MGAREARASLHGAVAAGRGDELVSVLRMRHCVTMVSHLHRRAARAHAQLHHRRRACVTTQHRPAARHSPTTCHRRTRRRRARCRTRRRRERLLLRRERQE